MIEDRSAAIKALSNKLEGYTTCTRVLSERPNPNRVGNRNSGVDDNLILVKNIDKLFRRLGLLESKLYKTKPKPIL